MTPHAFIAKWQGVELTERSASQSHFNDLCALVGVPDPVTADPKGEWFTFEKGVGKTTGGKGWADVWRRGCFAWEYKGPRRDLDRAFAQLQQYAVALENPPLLIVSDTQRFRLHTNWTNTVGEVHAFDVDELTDGATRDKLRWAFTDPERLRPRRTRQALTEKAAGHFAALAQRLRERGHEAQAVAHFVNRLVFCMFAEDVGLLPNHLFRRMLEHCQARPEDFAAHAGTLFEAMRAGGMVGFERVEWFNGGLFDTADALPLERADVADLLAAARLDWSDIDPSILGTLFERGLDPAKRSQLGAHYTDRDKIMAIVGPVVEAPLLAEWAEARAGIEAALAREAEATAQRARTPSPAKAGQLTRAATAARAEAEGLHRGFIDRVVGFRVLDPACGSGNFLYLALLALHDVEHRANLDAEALGLARGFPRVGPEGVLGIEINPFAAELARVSVWIGEIQWMRRNGFEAARDPILRPLETIECRDAVLAPDGSRAEWPAADAIVGNPPFLGGKRLLSVIGPNYTKRLRDAYAGRVEAFADLVCYWFERAREHVERGDARDVGLVATNSIRGGASRKTLERIARTASIYNAWSDEAWVLDGAAVRVSLICFGREGRQRLLNSVPVAQINADLTAAEADLTLARRLPTNAGVCFEGGQKYGNFDIPGELARRWLVAPTNPNGRPNSDVLRPYLNAKDLVRRSEDRWIIDFGGERSLDESALYEAPFTHVELYVKEARQTMKRETHRVNWWRHGWVRYSFERLRPRLRRFIVTPVVAKHRVFCWVASSVFCSNLLDTIARDDDTTFGVLHSRFHELWALRMGTFLGVGNDPRYTPSTTFETFPFPEGLTPDRPAASYEGDPRARAIAEAAATLDARREAWLNPPDLVRRVPEVVPGYPDRLLPVDEAAAKELKKRTLTALYNARPAWLAHAHAALDTAVAAAYGWETEWAAGMSDDAILARLFALNQERAADCQLTPRRLHRARRSSRSDR